MSREESRRSGREVRAGEGEDCQRDQQEHCDPPGTEERGVELSRNTQAEKHNHTSTDREGGHRKQQPKKLTKQQKKLTKRQKT